LVAGIVVVVGSSEPLVLLPHHPQHVHVAVESRRGGSLGRVGRGLLIVIGSGLRGITGVARGDEDYRDKGETNPASMPGFEICCPCSLHIESRSPNRRLIP
jgi:hypothetical protein